MTENQQAIVTKINRLEFLHEQVKKASLLQKASMAENATGLAIQIIKHLAIEVLPDHG